MLVAYLHSEESAEFDFPLAIKLTRSPANREHFRLDKVDIVGLHSNTSTTPLTTCHVDCRKCCSAMMEA